jgi:hypothetical protein
MKRRLFTVLSFLLALICACNISSGALPKYSNEQWTAIAQTQQVMAIPGTDRIRNWLNASPLDYDRIDSLEEDLVGRYDVTSVAFPNPYYLELGVECECVTGVECCSPGRVFVSTMQRMQPFRDQILAELSPSVRYLDLVVYENHKPSVALYAPWDKVKKYLSREISGYELAGSVRQIEMP